MSKQKETQSSKDNFLNQEDISVLLSPQGATGEVRHAPESFKMGRTYSTTAPNTERGLFDSLEEQPEEERSITISGLTKTISETDLSHYIYAVRKILYNQSYTARNEDVNSGIVREETKAVKPLEHISGKGKKQRRELRPYYKPQILTSLIDLCKEAYGTDRPTTEHKKRIAKIIELVHSTPLIVEFPNGDKLEAPLVVNMCKYTRKEDGAIFYQLAPNPIFSGKEAASNFAQLPQRANYLLTSAIKDRGQRRTEAHLRFMERLAMQDPNKPFSIGLDNLLNYLNLTEYFRKNPKNVWGRTEADQRSGKLWAIFQIAVDTGQLKELPRIEQRSSDGKTMFVFTLNPDYCK